MPYFSKASMDRLKTCHINLQYILLEAIEYYDFTIIEGHRPKEKQNEAYNNGKSKLQWPNSKHNVFPSLAVDIAPYYHEPPHIRWDRLYEFVYLHGIVRGLAARRCITVRSGINWDMDDLLISDQGFNDFPHIEMIL